MPALALVNPRKRKTRRRRKASTKRVATRRRRASYPAKRRVRRYRRNPIGGRTGNIVINSFKDGFVGSLGAVAGSIALGALPLPDHLKDGIMGAFVRAGVGVGTGLLVSKFANRKLGEQMGRGAVTVALHDVVKEQIQTMLPNVNMGEYNDWGDDVADLGYPSAAPRMGAYTPSMGAYTPSAKPAMAEEETNMGAYTY